MSLFGKKKEKTKQPTCCCNGACESPEVRSIDVEGKPNIKVLGAGCKSCHMQYENVKEAVAALGLYAEVEYITDMEKVMSYGVMRMPALVVNEKVVSAGKVLSAKEARKYL